MSCGRARQRWRGSRLMVLAAWMVCLIVVAQFIAQTMANSKQHTHGFVAYYTASRLALEGVPAEKFYEDDWFREQTTKSAAGASDIYNLNAPSAATMLLPLAWLPHDQARFVWIALNCALLLSALATFAKAVGARSVWAPLILSFGLIYQPASRNMALGQAYVLLLTLFVLVWLGLKDQRPWLAGPALALALVLKPQGALIWLLLLARKRWRSLATGTASAALFVTGSIWLSGVRGWSIYLQRLPELMWAPWLAVPANQTIAGFFQHLFSQDSSWNPQPLVNAPVLGYGFQWAITTGMIITTLLVAIRREHAHLPFSAFILASLVASPYSLDYHFTLALLPIAILFQQVLASPTWARAGLLVAGMMLLASPLPFQAAGEAAGIVGFIAYPKLLGSVLLWSLCLLPPEELNHHETNTVPVPAARSLRDVLRINSPPPAFNRAACTTPRSVMLVTCRRDPGRGPL